MFTPQQTAVGQPCRQSRAREMAFPVRAFVSALPLERNHAKASASDRPRQPSRRPDRRHLRRHRCAVQPPRRRPARLHHGSLAHPVHFGPRRLGRGGGSGPSHRPSHLVASQPPPRRLLRAQPGPPRRTREVRRIAVGLWGW